MKARGNFPFLICISEVDGSFSLILVYQVPRRREKDSIYSAGPILKNSIRGRPVCVNLVLGQCHQLSPILVRTRKNTNLSFTIRLLNYSSDITNEKSLRFQHFQTKFKLQPTHFRLYQPIHPSSLSDQSVRADSFVPRLQKKLTRNFNLYTVYN